MRIEKTSLPASDLVIDEGTGTHYVTPISPESEHFHSFNAKKQKKKIRFGLIMRDQMRSQIPSAQRKGCTFLQREGARLKSYQLKKLSHTKGAR